MGDALDPSPLSHGRWTRVYQGVSCSAARDLLPAAGHVAHKASVGTSRPPYDAILFIYDAHNPTSFARY
eukprot:3393343-Rhodomonas_salina.1